MLGTIQIERNDIKISAEEVRYWKRIIKQNLKIGVEIEAYVRDSLNPETVRVEMKSLFSPTNDVGRFGKFGVMSVKQDGSINHGYELCTIGRRPDFLDLYCQYNAITSLVIDKYDSYVNERCGLHNHILLDYNGSISSMEKPMPGVIFRNFAQLVRRYLPELVYITSTCKGTNYITRYDGFCSAEKLIRTTPISRIVYGYIMALLEGNNDRYRFMNVKPMVCSSEEINKFHFEFRFPDGSLYPAQIAGQNMLYSAMLIKAVELSELGLINTGTTQEWEETKLLYNSIRNNSGIVDRTSSMPNSEQLKRIKQRCFEMLVEVKPQLDQYDSHIYGILYMLADKPISLLRRSMSDIEINNMFNSAVENMYNFNYDMYKDIIEVINLQQISKCHSRYDYEDKLSKKLNISVKETQSRLFKLNLHKPMDFDLILGSIKFN